MVRGEEIVLTIEGLSGEGKCVGRVDGLVIFVEGAVPGDTVRAQVLRAKKNYAEARVVELVTRSPLRVEPRCKHFGVCGGCKWQHLDYQEQLRFKKQAVIDAFVRIGGFADPPVAEPMGCSDPYFYRNKMEFTFSNRRWLTEADMSRNDELLGEVALGLHVPRRFDKVLDLEECWLQSERSSGILKCVRDVARRLGLDAYSTRTHEGYLRHLVIREGKRTGETMVNLVTTHDRPEVVRSIATELLQHFPTITTIVNNITDRKSMIALGEVEKVYHGPGNITEKLGGYTFRISANSFFQVNTIQAERLFVIARELAGVRRTDVVYDLYSGTGTIAIYLSDSVERVIGIEVVESAIEDAHRNAEENGIRNCFFLMGDLKDRLTKDTGWLGEHPRPTVVVADPPRSGMHPKVVEHLVRLAAERVVYVSCNPATQARDARQLADGGYRLRVVQPVDLFPHTDHIETAALFTR